MNAIRNKNIAIIGGGPGGLTLARLLQMNGANVKVYERDENRNVRVQGATLDLHEDSGLKALQEADLMDAFRANYRPGADKMRIADKNATILYDDDSTQEQDRSRPEIDRGPLRKILLDSLQSDTVVWDSQFVSLTQLADGVKIDFRNGTFAQVDLVIAADGANSKLRPYLTPIKAFYSGVTVIEGSVYNSEKNSPEMHELLNGGKIFALGDGKTIIVSSKGDGSLVFYTGHKADESWTTNNGIDFSDKTQVLAWFKKEFAGWGDRWNELFENAEVPFVLRPQYCMPLDQKWETSSVLTMLGDAAHLMPPYAGEGVNMAMLDALELAQCLLSESFTDTKTAIAAYEQQMLARASDTAEMTLQQTDSMHSPEGLENMLEMFAGH